MREKQMAFSIGMIKLMRRILQFPVAIVLACYYLLRAIVRPVVRPLALFLIELRIFRTLRGAIERIGPYPSLVLLIVPVVVVEPLKIVALGIMHSGRVVFGIIVLLVSEALSLLVVDRLFEVMKPKLLELHWFAVFWEWFTSLRDPLIEWFHSTWAWSMMLRVRNWARAAMVRVFPRWQKK